MIQTSRSLLTKQSSGDQDGGKLGLSISGKVYQLLPAGKLHQRILKSGYHHRRFKKKREEQDEEEDKWHDHHYIIVVATMKLAHYNLCVCLFINYLRIRVTNKLCGNAM